MTDRDELAALLRDALAKQNDDYPGIYVETDTSLDDVRLDGLANLLAVADAILAAGWQAPETTPEKQLREAWERAQRAMVDIEYARFLRKDIEQYRHDGAADDRTG